MIKYTETPNLQRYSKSVMTRLKRKYGVNSVLSQDINLVLIGDDWCYRTKDGLQLVTSSMANKLLINFGEIEC